MDNWKNSNDKLVKEFRFPTFSTAIEFVNSVAKIAESQDHHPDIYIHDYNNVLISTTTHDENNSVTQKDHALTSKIDEIPQ